MLIIAVVAGVCIKITRTKIDKVVNITYYAAYETLNTVSATLISNAYTIKKNNLETYPGGCTVKECPNGYAFNKLSCTCESISVTLPTAGNDFCSAIEEYVNVQSANCSGNNKSTIAQAVASGDFSGVTPDIVLRNGMKLYNVKNDYIEIPQLKDNMKSASRTPVGIRIANLYNKIYNSYKNNLLSVFNKIALPVQAGDSGNSSVTLSGADCVGQMNQVACSDSGGTWSSNGTSCTCSCKSGYGISKTIKHPTCVPCDGKCAAHCTQCDKCTGFCTACESGYHLDGTTVIGNTCEPCDKSCGANCFNCDKCTGKCRACKSGYHLSGNSCVQDCNKSCGSNCADCDTCTGKCRACSGGYELKDGSCGECNKSCGTGCTNCDACTGKCSGCSSDYNLVNDSCVMKTCDSSASNTCTSSGGTMSAYPDCKCGNCPEGYASDGAQCKELTCPTDAVNACVASSGTMSSYSEGCNCKCEEPYESTGSNTCKRKSCPSEPLNKCTSSGGNMTLYPDCECYCPAGMFIYDGKCITMDEGGYVVYVDVNGNAGDSILYEDVFPFYMNLAGVVIPAFPDDGSERGGNSKQDLEVSLQYDDYSGKNRVIKWLLKSTSFREAACKSGYVQTSAYCGSMSTHSKCKEHDSDCRIVPIKPIKM